MTVERQYTNKFDMMFKYIMGRVFSQQRKKRQSKSAELWKMMTYPKFQINMVDKNGQTPLILAVQCDLQMVSKLMTYNDLDVNIEDNNGKTALMYVIEGETTIDNIKLVTTLISHHSYKFNKVHERSFVLCGEICTSTDLMYAIFMKRDDIADLLLGKAETDVNLEDSEGQTAVTLVLQRSTFYWESVIKMLKKVIEHQSYDVNRYHLDGTIDITNAIRRFAIRRSHLKTGHNEVLSLLLSNAKVDINLRDHTGYTIYEMALEHADLALLNQILKYPELDRIFLNCIDLAYRNILHIMLQDYTSVEKDHSRFEHLDELCSTVLEYPLLNVSAKDIEGKSPVVYILNSADGMVPCDVIKKVIHHPKYHPTQTYFDGYVDIMRASHKLPSPVAVTVLEELIQLEQINVMVFDTKGTVLRYVQKAFTENGISAKLKPRLKKVQENIIKHKSYDVNREFNGKCNDLLWAAGNGYWELLEELLELPNMDIHSKITSCNDVKEGASFLKSSCTKGMTLLHLTCKYCDPKSQIVQKLLKFEGVNVSAQDSEGYTCLMYAVTNHGEDVIRELLDHSSFSELSLKNNSGKTVFDIVKENVVDTSVVSLFSEIQTKKLIHLEAFKKLNGVKQYGSVDCLSLNQRNRRLVVPSSGVDIDTVDIGNMKQSLSHQAIDQIKRPSHHSLSVTISELHQRKLLGNQSYLCEHLSPKDLLQNMLQKQIITEEDVISVVSAGTRRNVVLKLLSFLLSRNSSVYEHFLNGLRITGQGYIADELDAFNPVELLV